MNARDDRLDSAKGILITLVVLGHWLEATNYWDDGLIRYLLTAIYAFHMPAFVFLAGITSKPDNVGRRIAVLVSLLVIFQCLYFAYLPLTGSNKQFEWTDPFWMLWFMLGMVWWLVAIAIAQFAPRTALLVSIVAGLAGGAVPAVEYIPALDRALYFLPWFMAGYVMGQPAFYRAAQSSRGVAGILLLTSLLFASLLWYLDIGSGWLYGSNGFAVLDVPLSQGVFMRTALMIIAVSMTWAMIASAGVVREVFVKAGKRSLAIYLLHGLFILPLTPFLGLVFEHHGAVVASLVCIAATWLVVFILSLSVFDRKLRALGSHSAGLLINAFRSLRKTVNPA